MNFLKVSVLGSRGVRPHSQVRGSHIQPPRWLRWRLNARLQLTGNTVVTVLATSTANDQLTALECQPEQPDPHRQDRLQSPARETSQPRGNACLVRSICKSCHATGSDLVFNQSRHSHGLHKQQYADAEHKYVI